MVVTPMYWAVFKQKYDVDQCAESANTVRLRIYYIGHNARIMLNPICHCNHLYLDSNSHPSKLWATSVTLASFIQLRAVVCVSYVHTAVLIRQSVFHTAPCNVLLLQNWIRREVVLLFIYRLYIFILFNMRVILLANILYCSFISRAPGWEPLTYSTIYQHCLRN